MPNSVWLKAGGVVLAAGHVVLCDHCPCGTGTCCPGATLPDTRHLTVTSADPGNCPCVVGTFLLTLTPGTTRYLSDPIACADYHTGKWGIICSGDALASTRWHLFFLCDDAVSAVVVATWLDGDPWCSTFEMSGSGSGPVDVSFNNVDCCVSHLGPFGGEVAFDFTVGA